MAFVNPIADTASQHVVLYRDRKGLCTLKPITRLTFVICAVVVANQACTRRPPTVPEGAVPVTFSKNGGWAYCWLDASAQVNRCRTYNADGQRLYRFRRENDDDDVFLPYAGGGPVPQEQLRIDIQNTQPDYVWLQNGIVLLPRNDFEHLKGFIDELMRYRK